MNIFYKLGVGIFCFAFILPIGNASDGLWDWMFSVKRYKGVEVVKDDIYEEECGACHFPFQPGLLPAKSWEKLIDAKALADHFGDDAELDEKTRLHIANLLSEKAADNSYYKRSRKVMASLEEGVFPLRINEVPYIKDKHQEIPNKLIKENPEVKSLSACQKCHQKIKEGIFDDDTVIIPGHGTW